MFLTLTNDPFGAYKVVLILNMYNGKVICAFRSPEEPHSVSTRDTKQATFRPLADDTPV